MKLIEEKLDRFEVSINRRFDDLEAKVVSRSEFEPVKKIVYGAVSLILSGIVIALISLVVRK